MKNPETIFTLNARDNIIFDIAFNKSDTSEIYKEINNVFGMFISSLSERKINYQDLKNCLIPRKDRKEIAFIFDTEKITTNYAILAISKILPILDKGGIHSFLVGDYVGESENRYKLLSLFREFINQVNPTNYQYHNQFFIVYINNLSTEMVNKLINQLKVYEYFIGYMDVTFSSKIKTYFSGILNSHFIKYKSILILGDPNDTNIIDDLDNNVFCDYEELGFTCQVIHLMYYYIFLSYKIEREVLPIFDGDTKFTLNSLSDLIVNVEDCTIEIEENKFDYIMQEKTKNLERAGIINLSIEELKTLIKSKINSNYFYNLTFLPKWNTLKFNILIEVSRTDSPKLMKLLIALEYKPSEKKLRLITMF